MATQSSFSNGPRRQKIKGEARTISISLSEEQYQILRKHSYFTGKSVSMTINSFLDFKLLTKQANDLANGKDIPDETLES